MKGNTLLFAARVAMARVLVYDKNMDEELIQFMSAIMITVYVVEYDEVIKGLGPRYLR